MIKANILFKKLISNTTHFFAYVIISLVFIFACFALYVKINPINVSFLIDQFKKEGLIDDGTDLKALYLSFDRSFIIQAHDITVKTDVASVYLRDATMRLARSSVFTGRPSFREIDIEQADIFLDLDQILENKQVETKQEDDIYSALKNYSYLSALELTKHIDIEESNITIVYNNNDHVFNNIDIKLEKTDDSLDFSSTGRFVQNDSATPIEFNMIIPDSSEIIDLSLTLDSIYVKRAVDSITNLEGFAIDGVGSITLTSKLNNKNEILDIKGSAKLLDGYVAIDEIYNNKLEFNSVSTDFEFKPDNQFVRFYNTKLHDKNDLKFTASGDFSYKDEPKLNVTAKTDYAKLKNAFLYIPDLDFKEWLTENLHDADASNISFGYYGPFKEVMDGVDGNPYLSIAADFDNLEMNYMPKTPLVKNAKGRFTLLKENINIAIERASHSQQNISRANVTIAPLFKEDDIKLTVTALSQGSVEDVLSVLNETLELKQDKLFKNYKGKQETQTTIVLNLDRLIDEKDDAFELDIKSYITDVQGVDPIFNQKFRARDALVNVTEEEFTLKADGFFGKNPFSVELKEDLLNFGENTKLSVNTKFDSFLFKEQIKIPTLNMSGVIDGKLDLEKVGNSFKFDITADIQDTLINLRTLNYTKPYSKKGNVVAKGSFNQKANIFKLDKAKIDISDFMVDGSANLVLNDLLQSKVKIKNLLIADKTKVDSFTLENQNLSIIGDKLDLRPLNILKAKKEIKKSAAKEDELPEFKTPLKTILVKLNRLELSDKEYILDVDADFDLRKNIKGSLTALNKEGEQNFFVHIVPDDENPNRSNLRSIIPNFGTALRKAGIMDNINAGFAVFSGSLYFTDENKFDSASINLNLKNFQLLRAPLLAKMLAVISLDQLFTNKKGILFDEMFANFNINDDIVKINNGKVRGPSLGLSLEGAYDLKTSTSDLNGILIPVVKLNSVLSNIPIIGYILTGSQGALSGADFKIFGTGDPEIAVFPISVVTPGIIKDIFDSVYSAVSSDTGESQIINDARKRAEADKKGK